MKTLYRHGDILVAEENQLPQNAVERPGPPVLAYGEATGHSHRIEDPATVTFYSVRNRKDIGYFVVAAETARLIHQEHGPIVLPRGIYRFWHQREYTPQAIRRVVD